LETDSQASTVEWNGVFGGMFWAWNRVSIGLEIIIKYKSFLGLDIIIKYYKNKVSIIFYVKIYGLTLMKYHQ